MITPEKDLNRKIVVLVGPTAIGKTELSLVMAEEFGAEIISMDSMQIYRYMDIGTAKPSLAERRRVPHHLVDYVDPAEAYHVGRYVADARLAIAQVAAAGRLPMLVGGTGLYLRGLLEGIFASPAIPAPVREKVLLLLREKGPEFLHRTLAGIDPPSAARIHPHDSQRLSRALEIWEATGIAWSRHLELQREAAARGDEAAYQVLKIGLHCERGVLYERINRRVGIMVEQGLVGEVEALLARGYGRELNSMQSIGYRHMINYLDGVWPWEEALACLARDTRRYAKRQLTWFTRDKDINWFRPDEAGPVMALVDRFYHS
jgi:tRNA dimethylallyltransferase